jgi:hypothetical protein
LVKLLVPLLLAGVIAGMHMLDQRAEKPIYTGPLWPVGMAVSPVPQDQATDPTRYPILRLPQDRSPLSPGNMYLIAPDTQQTSAWLRHLDIVGYVFFLDRYGRNAQIRNLDGQIIPTTDPDRWLLEQTGRGLKQWLTALEKQPRDAYLYRSPPRHRSAGLTTSTATWRIRPINAGSTNDTTARLPLASAWPSVPVSVYRYISLSA